MDFSKKLITTSFFFGFFIIGMTISIASPILIEISRTLNKPIYIVTIIFTAFFAGYAAGPIVGNLFLRIFSRKILIGIMFFSQTLFLYIFSFSQNIFISIGVFFIIGLCGGFFDMILTAILAEIYLGREGFLINVSHVFLSLGAFAGPYISSFSIKLGYNWQISFYAASIISFINFIFFIFIKIPVNVNNKSRNKITKQNITDRLSIIRDYKYLILLLIFAALFYTFSESGLNSWIPTFLRLFKNFNQINSSQVLSFFWLAIAIGRIIIGLISFKIDIIKITIFISIMGAIFIILGILVENKLFSGIYFSIAGLFYSGIFPNILTIGSIYFKKLNNIVLSLIVTFAAIGALIAPQVLGTIYKFFDLKKAFVILSIAVFIEAILIFFVNYGLKSSKFSTLNFSEIK
ncbi:MAG: MFS transporter [Actinobacteria bacterium]|nr:MFS transporter [Actinomycetota bacterium]MCL5986904.1 MFS transporter [Actinomycetota bacterium]